MSNKQQKKIRQLIRRNERRLVSDSWDMFFETMSKLPLKYRIKMALKIIGGKNIREKK